MVPQVGGDVRVDVGGPHLREETVAGPSADRDATDRAVRVPGRTDALRGGGQRGGDRTRELRERYGPVEFADPAEAAAARRVVRVGHERAQHAEAERAREGVGDAGVGAVGVGVGDVQGDAVPDQGVHDAALEGPGGHGRRAAQVERVVRDEELGAEGDRLVRDAPHRVDGEEDGGDLRVRVTADRTDGVPLLGASGGPEVFQRADDFGECGHG